MPGQFRADIDAIRQRARDHMEDGPVTTAYHADRDQVIAILNDVLATEIVCTLRYRNHYYMARGFHAEVAKDEFLQHAQEEQQHVDWVAQRIAQLGGVPNMSPEGLATRSHAHYAESERLDDMIREDLVAERIAIQMYAEIVRWLGEDDPTTRRLMEDVLKQEEEHADDMASLLEMVSSRTV
jgi:bacterioferritin